MEKVTKYDVKHSKIGKKKKKVNLNHSKFTKRN